MPLRFASRINSFRGSWVLLAPWYAKNDRQSIILVLPRRSRQQGKPWRPGATSKCGGIAPNPGEPTKRNGETTMAAWLATFYPDPFNSRSYSILWMASNQMYQEIVFHFSVDALAKIW